MNQLEHISERQENQAELTQANYDPTAPNWSCQWQDYEYGVNYCTLEQAIEHVSEYIRGEVEILLDYDYEMAEFYDQETGGKYSQKLLQRVIDYTEQTRLKCIATGRAEESEYSWGVDWMGGTEE